MNHQKKTAIHQFPTLNPWNLRVCDTCRDHTTVEASGATIAHLKGGPRDEEGGNDGTQHSTNDLFQQNVTAHDLWCLR